MCLYKKIFLGIVPLIVVVVCMLFMQIRRTVTVSSEEKQYIDLPIVMYHSVNKNGFSKFVISVEEFEKDLENIKLNSLTPIGMNDLIDYVYEGKELPENPIIITFDDGYYNNYLYAYPLLKKYKYKAVISPIGKFVDMYTKEQDKNPNYAHVSWEDLKEMQDSGLVEVQNHSYNMHTLKGRRNGTKKCERESMHDYKMALTEDVTLMQKEIFENLGTTATTFTYPFGAISKCSRDILKSIGFKATLGCANMKNKITRDPDCLYELGRFIRVHGTSSEKFFKTKILKDT